MSDNTINFFDGKELSYPCDIFFHYRDGEHKSFKVGCRYVARVYDVGASPEGWKLLLRGVKKVIAIKPKTVVSDGEFSATVCETEITIEKIRVKHEEG